ncbi:hypothetical protein NK6_3571 [Bradyrhizobium diazoefficiens]|uniref:Uncharacterized protein n=1 Tax=Bradyrhizobium diazoefficiens TaxID=1355477 RepID=A0A0E4FT17_9BRAD|nr:hypothetical protein NK6_3571 [Bradyrhizobium diazoefficiens]
MSPGSNSRTGAAHKCSGEMYFVIAISSAVLTARDRHTMSTICL